MVNKSINRDGYGKLFDAWVPPEHAGDPVGCLATTYTFDPGFFEEECLGRFLNMSSDPQEDGAVYLVEREEKMRQARCTVLVDQHHCRGTRSLRWDLLPARVNAGVLHSKITFLHWAHHIRLIISSANLTSAGYRTNREVFGVLDFGAEPEIPPQPLLEILEFLKEVSIGSGLSSQDDSRATERWYQIIDRLQESINSRIIETFPQSNTTRIVTILSGPKRPDVFSQLQDGWPGGGPPHKARVLSPFFDMGDGENRVAVKLWEILRKRGRAEVQYCVEVVENHDEDRIFIQAPATILDAQPRGRPQVTTQLYRLLPEENRPLHAKGLWLEDNRWQVYMIGSSNFTTPGFGLSAWRNIEANLAYVVDNRNDSKSSWLLKKSFPATEALDIDQDLEWKHQDSETEDEEDIYLPLPKAFGIAEYQRSEKGEEHVLLTFPEDPGNVWCILTEDDESLYYDSNQWSRERSLPSVLVPWTGRRPPSGFWVSWQSEDRRAWWPVNVSSPASLPPPEELKDLNLNELLYILTSSRPLHEVIRMQLNRKKHKGQLGQQDHQSIDPHDKVDTSQFLLRRMRRVSWALEGLRKKLEQPTVSIESLEWRLRGPVGVLALAKAFLKEGQSSEEKRFLLSELILELSRVQPQSVPGCISSKDVRSGIHQLINDLFSEMKTISSKSGPSNLRNYISKVFQAVNL